MDPFLFAFRTNNTSTTVRLFFIELAGYFATHHIISPLLTANISIHRILFVL